MVFSNTKEYEEIEGKIPILLTAPHAHPPRPDLHTGLIARLVAKESNCYALIAKVSRLKLDLNTSEGLNHGFRKRINELIKKGLVNYVLDIHGSKEEFPRPQIELGTVNFQTARKKTAHIIISILEKYGFEVDVDVFLKGEKTEGNIIKTHSNLKENVECVQVEIRRDLREISRKRNFKKLVAALTEVVKVLGDYVDQV